MPTFISLLRGINVSGHRKIKMAALAAACTRLDLTDVRTYVQSGNIVCNGRSRSPARLAKSIELMIQAEFGHDVAVVVRTPAEWARIIEGNPYATAAEKDPTKVAVMCLSARPTKSAVEALSEIDSGPDRFEVADREVYLFYPNGAARSKLTHAVIERKLGVRATARNWRTVMALSDMVQ